VKKDVYIILDNIRSIANVGAIFRTADAIGISKIYLTGYTPTPVDRFGRIRQDFAKTALGSEKSVPFEYHKDVENLIQKLQEENVEVVAVEQNRGSLDYKKFKLKKPTAFLFGNEVEGIPENILKHCDEIVEVPMKGNKESLNVSVTAGIVLFRVLDY
jgi:tRNA G18 (ribose-2'-O)-methylase SpoU